MIDSWTPDRTGWARFSDDKTMRYRLARALTPRGAGAMFGGPPFLEYDEGRVKRIVWLMVNPSTADAFKLDNTVTKCVQFSQRWGGDICEVVNLFALRSTDPKGLDTAWPLVGADDANNESIVQACTGAERVVASWVANGHRGDRGGYVRKMLVERGVKLEVLGFTGDGVYPLHPLARGKSFIPLTREPMVWT